MTIQKPERGMPVTVTLADGQEHPLRFPLAILKEMKVKHGLDFLKVGTDIAKSLDDPERLALVLSYGLRTATPEATPEWVEQNVDASMLFTIAPLLIYAATGQWVGDDLSETIKRIAANGTASPNGAASEATQNGHSTGSISGASDATISVSESASSGV